ncbi:MAG: hypothetical protein HY343_04215 [Lentisphaerae bacterium]|nr:hypothetical protein [Lentisphaerota bacterium]
MKQYANLVADLRSLAGFQHTCSGCTGVRRCCCAAFEVCVTRKEMEAMIGVMPAAAKYARRLREGDAFANVFERTPDGLFALDTDEAGLCVFAYRRAGFIRCSLHTAAIDLDISPSLVKPLACRLWPLAVTEKRPFVLGVSPNAGRFHCVARRAGAGAELTDDVLQLVESAFGGKTMRRLQK